VAEQLLAFQGLSSMELVSVAIWYTPDTEFQILDCECVSFICKIFLLVK
jgi:hypothetical protein